MIIIENVIKAIVFDYFISENHFTLCDDHSMSLLSFN